MSRREPRVHYPELKAQDERKDRERVNDSDEMVPCRACLNAFSRLTLRFRLSFAFLMLAAPPSCATMNLLDGFDPAPTHDGSTLTPIVGCITATVALLPAIVFDILTFPIQLAFGYYPYGSKCKP